jgi:hypothetical protein
VGTTRGTRRATRRTTATTAPSASAARASTRHQVVGEEVPIGIRNPVVDADRKCRDGVLRLGSLGRPASASASQDLELRFSEGRSSLSVL